MYAFSLSFGQNAAVADVEFVFRSVGGAFDNEVRFIFHLSLIQMFR